MIELTEMAEKHNTLITIDYGTYGIVNSKSVIMLVLCLFLAKKSFSSIFTQFFKKE